MKGGHRRMSPYGYRDPDFRYTADEFDYKFRCNTAFAARRWKRVPKKRERAANRARMKAAMRREKGYEDF